MIDLKNLSYLLLSIIIVFYCNQTFSKTPEQIIQDSISQYPGKCPCPYSIMSNGKKCGKRSAYSKPGGMNHCAMFLILLIKKTVKMFKKK